VWLRQLELESFRNISCGAIELCPRFNFFFGSNGAGKTAILEAVTVLARARSFRTQQVSEVIQDGRDGLVVRGTVHDELRGTQRLVLARSRSGSTELRINGQSARRMSQAAALLPLEVLDPSTVELVFGGPGWRRQWLDWGVFHVKQDYLLLMRRYSAALRQRNACLKAIGLGRQPVRALEPWTEEVAKLGEEVTVLREGHVHALRKPLRACMTALSDGLAVELNYRKGWPEGPSLMKFLSEAVPREVKLGVTSAGPHRADVEFRDQGMLCSVKFSRGQAKVLASALLLAQSDLTQQLAHRNSLFLIDDIGAELDEVHRERLFAALVERQTQVLATAVEAPSASILERCHEHRLFHVKQGSIFLE